MTTTATTASIVHTVQTTKGHLHVTEYPGEGPALVLTHGFPDDSRIYKRLITELSTRHIVAFDFLGHGKSGREATWPLTPGQRESELSAVVDSLGLVKPILFGHDSSGPVVINYTLVNPDAVGALALVDTYYANFPGLRFPEMIRLLADPHFTPLADAVIANPNILAWMLGYTDAQLREGPEDAAGVGPLAVLPQFFGDSEQPDAIAAIRAWTAELFTDLRLQDEHVAAGDLRALDVPVTVGFGADDPCLGSGAAGHVQALFRDAPLHEIAGASHWPMWDKPAEVAAILAELTARV